MNFSFSKLLAKQNLLYIGLVLIGIACVAFFVPRSLFFENKSPEQLVEMADPELFGYAQKLFGDKEYEKSEKAFMVLHERGHYAAPYFLAVLDRKKPDGVKSDDRYYEFLLEAQKFQYSRNVADTLVATYLNAKGFATLTASEKQQVFDALFYQSNAVSGKGKNTPYVLFARHLRDGDFGKDKRLFAGIFFQRAILSLGPNSKGQLTANTKELQALEPKQHIALLQDNLKSIGSFKGEVDGVASIEFFNALNKIDQLPIKLSALYDTDTLLKVGSSVFEATGTWKPTVKLTYSGQGKVDQKTQNAEGATPSAKNKPVKEETQNDEQKIRILQELRGKLTSQFEKNSTVEVESLDLFFKTLTSKPHLEKDRLIALSYARNLLLDENSTPKIKALSKEVIFSVWNDFKLADIEQAWLLLLQDRNVQNNNPTPEKLGSLIDRLDASGKFEKGISISQFMDAGEFISFSDRVLGDHANFPNHLIDWNMQLAIRQGAIDTVLFRKTFEFVGRTSLYRRSGFVEVHGASIDEVRTGPLELKKTILHMDEGSEELVLFWHPERGIEMELPLIRAKFDDVDMDIKAVQLILANCEGASASYTYNSEQNTESTNASPAWRRKGWRASKQVRGIFKSLVTRKLKLVNNGELVAVAPESEASECVQSIGLRILFNSPPKIIGIQSIGGFAPVAKGSATARADIVGNIPDFSAEFGLTVEAMNEDGITQKAIVSPEGNFAFSGLEPAKSYRIQAVWKGEARYSTRGRWWTVPKGRTHVKLYLNRLDINPERKPTNSKENRFFSPKGGKSQYSAIYASHASGKWVGHGARQEYDNVIFTNNFGHHDRDHRLPYAKNCRRVGILGSSTIDGLQVSVADHLSTLLSEELSVHYKSCFEVINASSNNNDPFASYQHFRDYVALFEPEIVFFETEPQLMSQMHPVLGAEYHGFDPDFPVKGKFYRNEQNQLYYVNRSLEYGKHLRERKNREFSPGLLWGYTFYVAPENMPKPAIETLDLFAEAWTWIKKKHPKNDLRVFSILRQATCRGQNNCFKATLKNEAGVSFSQSVSTFLEWFRSYCKKSNMTCVVPDVPAGYDTYGNHLVWPLDGHLSVAGHQWVSHVLFNSVLKSNP